jgi:hypothetical protein
VVEYYRLETRELKVFSASRIFWGGHFCRIKTASIGNICRDMKHLALKFAGIRAIRGRSITWLGLSAVRRKSRHVAVAGTFQSVRPKEDWCDLRALEERVPLTPVNFAKISGGFPANIFRRRFCFHAAVNRSPPVAHAGPAAV